jgi:hypothetical protein
MSRAAGRSGGLAPISLPLFQGVRLVVGEQFEVSSMVVLLCDGRDEHAPRARVVKRCRLSDGYGHNDAQARIGKIAIDPEPT